MMSPKDLDNPVEYVCIEVGYVILKVSTCAREVNYELKDCIWKSIDENIEGITGKPCMQCARPGMRKLMFFGYPCRHSEG